MSRRERLRLFAAGLAVTVIVAAVVLMNWVKSRRQAQENKAYWISEAMHRMQSVERAVRKYYLEHGTWPENNNLALVAPYLEQGRDGLLDPWGKPFKMKIVALQDETDGTFLERPVITCRMPTGEEIRYPEKVR